MSDDEVREFIAGAEFSMDLLSGDPIDPFSGLDEGDMASLYEAHGYPDRPVVEDRGPVGTNVGVLILMAEQRQGQKIAQSSRRHKVA